MANKMPTTYKKADINIPQTRKLEKQVLIYQQVKQLPPAGQQISTCGQTKLLQPTEDSILI